MIIADYPTTDLCLAATLRLNLVEMSHIRLTGKNKTRGVFHFKDVDREFLDAFDAGNVRVEPGEYHQMARRLTEHVRRLVSEQGVRGD